MPFCKKVWLIDDESISNFITQKALEINDFAAEVRSFTNAQEALAELEASEESDAFPDFIFLDLNMPVLSGWDFLEVYRKLSKEAKKNCTLYMLSSSLHEDDINKSKLYEDVRDFLSKPLNKIDLGVIKFQAKVIIGE